MALNLLTLPIELISVIMDGEVLRDLYNLTQVRQPFLCIFDIQSSSRHVADYII